MSKRPVMITVNALAVQLRIGRLIRAEIAASWKGSQPPEEHAAIEHELKIARAAYREIFAEAAGEWTVTEDNQ